MRLISQRDLDAIDHLTNNDVLHVYDVFEHEYLNDLLKKKGQPRCVITDHLGHINHPGVDVICLPLFGAQCAEKTKSLTDSDYNTEYIFNFMLNKKQVNRFVCLKLIEFFKLEKYNYTHSGFNNEFNMQEIIAELDSLGDQAPLQGWDRSFILAPSQIPPKYFLMSVDKKGENNIRLSITDVADAYHDHVQYVMKNSAVSLITESNWGQQFSTITEKTIYPVLALTMPIWIGGWQQATAWKRMGFDIFEDVINHDYQNYKTQIEQFYYAFANNLELLSNFEKTADIREQLMPRLKHNQELLLNGQLIRYIKNEIYKWPTDLQSIVPDLLKKFPIIEHHFK